MLASSIDLPPRAQHELLVLSDLSGPRPLPGFETYLTGYPLPGTAYFALARTWRADEISRPGCVWTHTILIPANALRGFTATSLVALHRRPAGDFSDYRSALEGAPMKPPSETDEPIAMSVLALLYENPSTPVWLEAETAQRYENVALAIWDQQWPSLRQRFSFSSGSLAPRFLDGKLLDLQIAPAHGASSWIDVSGGRRATLNVRRPPWTHTAAADLRQPGEFQTFLHAVGSGDRQAYADLADVFHLIRTAQSTASLVDVLEKLGDIEPLSLRQRTLAALLRDVDMPASVILPALLAWDALDADLTRRLKLGARAGRLARGKDSGVWAVAEMALAREEPISKPIISAIAEALNPSDLRDRSDEEMNAVLAIIDARPSLAALPSLWQTGEQLRSAVVEVLRRKARAPADIRGIARAAIQVLSADSVIRLSQEWPGEVLAEVLSAVREGYLTPERAAEYRALIASNAALIGHLLASPKAINGPILALLADSLVVVPEVPLSRWVEWAQQLGPDDFTPTRAAYLMHIVLTTVDRSGAALLRHVFDYVHDMAARGALSDRVWSILDADLPHLGFFRDWDRCERIRRGATTASKRNRWSRDEYLGITSSTQTRRLLTEALGE